MLGILYILLSFLTGYSILELLFKNFGSIVDKTFGRRELGLSGYFIRLPAYFVTGVLSMTWPLYIIAYIFRDKEEPLLLANIAVISAALVFSVVSVIIIHKRKSTLSAVVEIKKLTRAEKVVMTLCAVLICFIMFGSLGYVSGKLKIGLSVFSDFSTHLSMMRSFSHMNNFPTRYTFFGGEDVKYHFMFQFFCGNLEYLGLRTDLALNIPSIISMLFSYFMLYVLACKLSGKRAVGLVTLGLYSFRSSSALFEYALELPKGEVLSTIFDGNVYDFIGSTNHEDWGLWNLNVYCNQRHFSFSLTVMLLVIVLMLPSLYDMGEKLKKYMEEEAHSFSGCLKVLFFSKEGWLPGNPKICIYAGLLLGFSGFFNGAVLIGTVIVLFFIAAGSARRIEFVILAAIAGFLSMLQSKFFITSSLFDLEFRYGFLSEPATLLGSIDFIRKLMGILPLVLLVQFVRMKKVHKYIMVCFSMPIIFAFTISLTPDIAVNHKYVMIAIMLLDVYAAALVVFLFEKKDIFYRALAVITAACLTLTGIYEFMVLARKNTDNRSIQYAFEDDIMDFIWENASRDDIFLTANYYLMYSGYGNSIVLSGAQMYNGWEYFSWSAGYDTAERDRIECKIYSAQNTSVLYKLVDLAGIDYIVVDRLNRDSDMYELNEKVIDSAFAEVFSTGEGEDKFTIYDTKKRTYSGVAVPVG